MDFFKEFRKALGGKNGEMFKRFSAHHKGMIANVARHVGDAMTAHKGAMVEHRKAHKAHGAAIDECAKAMGHMEKALEVCKTHTRKAATASESTEFPHVEVAGHLQAAHDAMAKALKEHMPAGMNAEKAAHDQHLRVHDDHELAKGALTKVASSWVGEESESPAATGAGYDPRQAGFTSNMPQSRVTEGDVPETDPFNPMYDWKAAHPEGASAMTKAEQELHDTVADLKRQNEEMRKQIAIIGNQPTDPKGHLYGANGANGGQSATVSTPGSIDAIVKDLHARGKISDFELQNWQKDPEVRQRLASKVIGYQAVSIELGNPNLGKSILHPAFRGDADAVGKRAAAGPGVFNPNVRA